MNEETYNAITSKIISACIEVHRHLGPGLLESVYEVCLVDELKMKGLRVSSQVQLPVIYKERQLEKSFVIDLLVEDLVVIELKAVEVLLPIHEVQLVTYLKLSGKKLGLLVNFNVELVKNGIRRKINGSLNA
ncbi:MAG: GxxExxY protein [Bacteroidetes bacterium]|nr:GxxExxY protein [Bacteroidota bacterium]